MLSNKYKSTDPVVTKSIKIKWYYKHRQGEYFGELTKDVFGDFSVFMWEEGNWCCDCNRSLMFDFDEELDCGYEVSIQIYDLAGNCLLDELEIS